MKLRRNFLASVVAVMLLTATVASAAPFSQGTQAGSPALDQAGAIEATNELIAVYNEGLTLDRQSLAAISSLQKPESITAAMAKATTAVEIENLARQLRLSLIDQAQKRGEEGRVP